MRYISMGNQENQDSSGNKKNVIQGRRPDMENRQTHTKKPHKIIKIIHTK